MHKVINSSLKGSTSSRIHPASGGLAVFRLQQDPHQNTMIAPLDRNNRSGAFLDTQTTTPIALSGTTRTAHDLVQRICSSYS